jgi:hypothetical protein
MPLTAPTLRGLSQVSDYYGVILHPMDFDTMSKKHQAREYESKEAFLQDCRRMVREGGGERRSNDDDETCRQSGSYALLPCVVRPRTA